MKTKLNRIILPTLVVSAVMGGTMAANATTDLGNPYSPTGANYTLTAYQGVNSTNGSGGTTNGAQVNSDFEFKGTLGVAYTDSKNKLTDFGLGIYSSNGLTLSTGLNVQLTQASAASSVSVTMADFDIKSTATAFDYKNKVAPSVLVFGAGNNVLFSADPTAIFNAMTAVAGKDDYWNLDFGKLLSNAGQSANQTIGGFLLYADSTHGEKVPSDPYFITSINGGIPAIPEPRTYLAGAVLVALLIGAHARTVLKNRASAVAAN